MIRSDLVVVRRADLGAARIGRDYTVSTDLFLFRRFAPILLIAALVAGCADKRGGPIPYEPAGFSAPDAPSAPRHSGSEGLVLAARVEPRIARLRLQPVGVRLLATGALLRRRVVRGVHG